MVGVFRVFCTERTATYMCGLKSEDITLKFRLMEYNRRSMESRRSIGFKAFLSLVALYLVV